MLPGEFLALDGIVLNCFFSSLPPVLNPFFAFKMFLILFFFFNMASVNEA